MDRTMVDPQQWGQLIEDELKYRAVKPLNANLEPSLVCDRARNRFVLLFTGWHDGRAVDEIVAHIEIRDDEIWIFDDKIGPAYVVPELFQAGVPREKIRILVSPSRLTLELMAA